MTNTFSFAIKTKHSMQAGATKKGWKYLCDSIAKKKLEKSKKTQLNRKNGFVSFGKFSTETIVEL